jgi:hypothetical protein
MTIGRATSIDSGRRILILGEWGRGHHRQIVVTGGTLCQWFFLHIIF